MNRSLLAILVLGAVLGGSFADAATLTWNPTMSVTGVVDAAGAWDGATTNWWSGAGNTNWTDANPDSAIFGAANGTAGTVTVSVSRVVGGITFNPAGSGTYTITGSTLTLSNTPTITANTNATISSVLAGTASGLTKAGMGTLTLNPPSANTYTNTTTVNAGALVFAAVANPTVYAGGDFFVNNGSTLRFTGSRYDLSAQSGGHKVTFTFDANGGGTFDTSSGVNLVDWNGNTYATLGGTQNFMIGSSGLNINSGITDTFNITRGTGTSDLKMTTTVGNTGGIAKTGNGILEMDGANTYSGATAINQGTVTLGVGGTLANTVAITISNGATLNLSGAANNQIQASAATPALTINGTLAATTAQAHTLYASTITLNNGTMTSSATVPTYGAFFAGANRTITANGTSNTISSVNFGIVGTATVTLNTPLATDSLTASTVFFDNTAGASVAKSGLGTLILSGTNTYTGATTINGGTLQLGAGGSISNSTVILVGSNSTFDVSPVNFALKSTQTFEGYGSVTGNVSAVAGTKIIPGVIGTAGTLTFNGNLTLNAGVTNYFDLTSSTNIGGGVNDLLTINGDFETTNSAVAINVLSPLSSGSYRLINYTISSGGPVLNLLPGSPARATWALNTNTAGQVNLDVATTNLALRWSANTSATWDFVTTNWTVIATSAADRFFDADSVLFDDSGATSNIVTLATAVKPAAVTVNSTSNYTIQGAGKISSYPASPATLTKDGGGTLTIATTNDYAGVTIVSNGTLAVSSSSALGVSAVTLNNGVTLTQAGGSFTVSNSIALPGATVSINDAGNTFTLSGSISGGAVIVKTNTGTLTLSGTNTYTGPTTIGAGTLTVGGSGQLGGGTYAAAITNNGAFTYASSAAQTNSGVISGTGTLTMSGSGTFVLTGGSANTYTGLTTVSGSGNMILSAPGGVVAVSGNISMPNASSPNLWMTANNALGGSGVLTFAGASGNARFYLEGTTQTLAGVVENDGSTGGVVQNSEPGVRGPSNSGLGMLILTGSGSYSFSGYLRDSTGKLGLTMNGSGTQTLTGTRIDFTGPTYVNSGALLFTNVDDCWSTNIFINSGASVIVDTSSQNYQYKASPTWFTGAGSFIKMGGNSLFLGINNGGVKMSMSAGGLIDVRGGTMRNEYGSFNTWTNNSASLSVSNGATFNVWDCTSYVDALNGAGTVDANYAGYGLVVGVAGGSGTFSGTIKNSAGTLFLTKNGSGTETLTGTNTYTGTTTINGGRLVLGATGSTTGTPMIIISTSAVFDVSSIGNLALGNFQSLEGGGMVTGSVTMSAGGKLIPGTPGTAGTLSFANNLSLNAGTTNYFDLNNSTGIGGGTNDLVAVAGNLAGSNSTIAIALLAPPANGSYTLFTYGGVLSSNFNPTVLGNTTRSEIWTLNQGVPNQITLGVTGAGGGSNLLWRAYANANWDFVSTNWLDGAIHDFYYDGDSVTFDDVGAVASTVSLATRFVPASVTVNSASNYVFSGSGSIAGPAALTKSGAGTLTLNTTNTFTGPIGINAGSLAINRSDSFIFTNTLSGAGTLYKQGASTMTYAGNSTLSGTIKLANGATLTVATNGSITGLGTATKDNNTTATWNINGTFSVGTFNGAYVGGNYSSDDDYLNINAGAIATMGTFYMAKAGYCNYSWSRMTVNVYGTLNATTINGWADDGGSNYDTVYRYLNVYSGGRINAATIDLSPAGGANTFIRSLTLSGGTLANLPGGNLTVDSTTQITLNTNGIFDASAGYSITINGVIDTGSLIKTGAGTLLLTAANTYSGSTAISNGTLLVNGSVGTGAVTVVAGATLSGNGVVNGVVTSSGVVSPGPAAYSAGILTLSQNYTQSSGGTLNIELGGAVKGSNYDCLAVSNTATLDGALNVSFINNYLPSGTNTYTVLTAGSVSGTFASTNLSIPAGLSLAVQYTTTSVVLTVTGNADTLMWQPTVAANWDVTSSNWYYMVATVTGLYSQGSTVIFNDTGAYSNNINLALPMTAPASVTVNSSSNYSLSGAGYLAGSMSLMKTGIGALVMSTTNTYTGTTTIKGGSLTIAGAGMLGAGNYQATITNNGSFVYSSMAAQTLGGIISGTGTVTQAGTGTLTYTAANTYTGPTIVNTGTLMLARTAADGTGQIRGDIMVNAGATLNWPANAANTFGWQPNTFASLTISNGTVGGSDVQQHYYNSSANHPLTMIGGTLLLAQATQWRGTPITVIASPVTAQILPVSSTASMQIRDGLTQNITVGDGPQDIDLLVAVSVQQNGGGSLYKDGAGKMVLSAANSYNGTTTINGGALQIGVGGTNGTLGLGAVIDNAALVFNRSDSFTNNYIISGTGTLVKAGSGALTIVGTNTANSGGTYVSNGTLIVNGKIGAGPVGISSGATLFVNSAMGGGDVSIAAGAMLTGTGIIGGSVSSDGNISIGGSSLGILTIDQNFTQTGNGILNIRIGGVSSYDQLVVSNAVTLGGSLNVSLTNGYTGNLGDVFFILNGGTGIGGSFATTNLSSLATGLVWNVSNIGTYIILSVTNAPSPSGYNAWASAITNGQTAYHQFATGDGYPNLLKYATGSSPTSSDTLASMGGGRSNGLLTLSFKWNTNATDVSLIVEGANSATNSATWNGIVTNADGGGWGGTPNATVQTNGTGNPLGISVTDSTSAGTNRFLRLRVTQP